LPRSCATGEDLLDACAAWPAWGGGPESSLAVGVTLISIEVAAGVARLIHCFEVQGVVPAGGADLDLAEELVALVGIGRELVAEVGLVVFPGPARGIDIMPEPA
jgi:hypothetical protein